MVSPVPQGLVDALSLVSAVFNSGAIKQSFTGWACVTERLKSWQIKHISSSLRNHHWVWAKHTCSLCPSVSSCRTWRCTTSSPSATPWSSSGGSTGWHRRKPRRAWISSSTFWIYLRRTAWSEISGRTIVLTPGLLWGVHQAPCFSVRWGFTASRHLLTQIHEIKCAHAH